MEEIQEIAHSITNIDEEQTPPSNIPEMAPKLAKPEEKQVVSPVDPVMWEKEQDPLHSKSTPKSSCRPLFSDILSYFEKSFLFEGASLLSKFLAEPICFKCIVIDKVYKENQTDDFTLIINKEEAYVTITKLLYGFRCMLAHSNGSKTFRSTLKKFPTEAEFMKLMHEDSSSHAIKQFYELYKEANKANKGEISSCYPWFCEVVNLYRFIVVMVHRLHNVVVRVFQTEYDVKFWDELEDLEYKYKWCKLPKHKGLANRTL